MDRSIEGAREDPKDRVCTLKPEDRFPEAQRRAKEGKRFSRRVEMVLAVESSERLRLETWIEVKSSSLLK